MKNIVDIIGTAVNAAAIVLVVGIAIVIGVVL